MLSAWIVVAVVQGVWIILLSFRGLFWLPRPVLRVAREPEGRERVVPVSAVIPARDEEEILGSTLPTVLRQRYSGNLSVVVVDDRSEDGTADVARDSARKCGGQARLTVCSGLPLLEGWAGKVWAMAQGARHPIVQEATYLWFTDADIAHSPDVLQALVSKAEADSLDLVSVMARLRVDSWWDRLLIPAFVYFFAKLYPFRLVNNPRRRTAGAAGGCLLMRRTALERAGGVEAIRDALIDDCAMGRLIKRSGGRVWLGFSQDIRSIRRYGTLKSIWDMVARSAYDQLGYSSWLLCGTVLGMLILYALAPVATLWGAVGLGLGTPGSLMLTALGAATWGTMAASFAPILRHHRVGVQWAPLLPLAGVLYTLMTVSSAWRHRTGRGGAWKGRTRGASP